MITALDGMYQRLGYRTYKAEPEQIKIYYKFYQEGFQVSLVVDETEGFGITPQQYQALSEKVLNLFYHPEGILPGFPEGLPIYQVSLLTILVGNRADEMRNFCAVCKNVWVLHENEKRLYIYENQPGEMFGLRREMETVLEQCRMTPQQTEGKWAQARRHTKRNRGAFPYITAWLAATNIIVFLAMYIASHGSMDAVYIVTNGGVFPPYVVERGEWWRIFMAMFIHFDASHLLNNMVMLCCVGSILEKAMGHFKYAIVYLLSGIGGGLLSLYMMLQENSFAVSAGASGAIFGLIGGLLWVVLVHKGRYSGLTGRGMLLMLAISLYYGFATTGVDNWAHIGGMMTGFVVTIFLYRRNRQKD